MKKYSLASDRDNAIIFSNFNFFFNLIFKSIYQIYLIDLGRHNFLLMK